MSDHSSLPGAITHILVQVENNCTRNFQKSYSASPRTIFKIASTVISQIGLECDYRTSENSALLIIQHPLPNDSE